MHLFDPLPPNLRQFSRVLRHQIFQRHVKWPQKVLVRTLWRRSVNPTARDDVIARSLCVFLHGANNTTAVRLRLTQNSSIIFYFSLYSFILMRGLGN